MNITVHSSKSVKPANGGGAPPSAAGHGVVPLTVFDEVNHDDYVPGVFVFHPPAPPAAALEAGLARMLAEYRHWAGRLVTVDAAATGKRAILLNDAGARLVEATADVALAAVMPLRVGPEAVKLHPSCGDGGGGAAAEELMLVQVIRFPCGSFAVGYTMHHSVADGFATATSLLAWGQTVRGVPFDPAPVHRQAAPAPPPFFAPRDPPLVEFQHRGAEYKPRQERNKALRDGDGVGEEEEEVVVQTVHFRREFIARLRSEAGLRLRRRRGSTTTSPSPYSAAQCVVAHLWRCVTAARRLGASEVTALHVAVNGRGGRMRRPPPVPTGYTGNAVLWARPAATVGELLGAPLRRAAELVAEAVAGVDDRYFRSFVDFASSGAVEREGLVRTAVSPELVARTNLEVDSVLGIPFYGVDFGSGKPLLFMPTYSTPRPVEGAVFLVESPPSSSDDGGGGVVAHVPLFRRDLDAFNGCCYNLMMPAPVADARL